MSRPPKRHTKNITLGPEIPIIPIKDFSTFKLKREDWTRIWQVVGPSVDRNMQADVPLWLIIASAYVEGINHGYGLAKDSQKNVE